MALEFSDFNLTPDERVKSRKAAIDDYINVAQPATKAQEARERGQLADEVYYQSQQAAQRGMAASPILAKATQQAAELLPQQAQRRGEMAYAGAKMKEDILGAKQTGAVSDYERATEEYKQKMADTLAAKAFEMNYSSKELALSMNGYLADRGMQLLYKDLQAGRVSAYELQNLQNRLAMEAKNKMLELEKELETLQYKLKEDLAKRDFDAAQARLKAVIDRQKQIASDAAKANSIGAAISGAVSIGAGLVAGAISGGNPVAIAGTAKTTRNVIENLFDL